MHKLGLALALCAALGVGGCGNKHAAVQKSATADATTPVAALVPNGKVPDAAASNGVPQSAAAPKPHEPTKAARTNEDGSETVDDTGGDNGAQNALFSAVASTVGAVMPSAKAAATSGPSLWQEGKNYTRLVPAQPTDVSPGQVEVLEFFWYACPHCFSLDPMIESWKKSKPAYVTFVRVPVMWNDGHRSLARLFYTLQSLNKLDQLHAEVFKEIQVNGNPLIGEDPSNAAAAERVQLAFARQHGISEKEFSSTYRSMSVDTALIRADQLMQRYHVDGVPTFVVNGKYIADVRSADGPERLISLIGDLAAQEHKP